MSDMMIKMNSEQGQEGKKTVQIESARLELNLLENKHMIFGRPLQKEHKKIISNNNFQFEMHFYNMNEFEKDYFQKRLSLCVRYNLLLRGAEDSEEMLQIFFNRAFHHNIDHTQLIQYFEYTTNTYQMTVQFQ